MRPRWLVDVRMVAVEPGDVGLVLRAVIDRTRCLTRLGAELRAWDLRGWWGDCATVTVRRL